MHILHVGIFQDHCLGGDIVFRAGFLKNSIRPREFDYRSLASHLGVEEMNRLLLTKAKGTDLVFIGKGELVDVATLAALRRAGTRVAIWYGDVRPEPEPWLVRNLSECDAFFMSSAGDVLEYYFDRGRPARAAFFLNPSNPDLISQYADIPRSLDPPLFAATMHDLVTAERLSTYEYLSGRRDIQIVGSPARHIRNRILRRLYLRLRPTVYLRGSAYIEKIIRARFGIGVSSFQNIKYYTSDRLTHYLTFGKLFLAWRFPACEHLLQDGIHLVYFEGIEDLRDKIDFYLTHYEAAEDIGRQGQEKMLRHYNTANMVKMMLEIICNGRSRMFPWVEVYS